MSNNRPVLSVSNLFTSDGIVVADVACSHARGRGHAHQHGGSHTIVFVRRGCFVRSANGIETLLDSTRGYCMRPGEEERYDHPHDCGDACTALTLEPALVASLRGGDVELPVGVLPTPPHVDLEQRLLLAHSRRNRDSHEVFERAILLAASALEEVAPDQIASGRPSTTRSRRLLADDVRQALEAHPQMSLPELSAHLTVSPHHLSRVFKTATGSTITRHRMRLRVRRALERLSGGERDLGRLAVETGFADQSHLCRVVRTETGQTPSALRAALATSH